MRGSDGSVGVVETQLADIIKPLVSSPGKRLENTVSPMRPMAS